MRLPFLRPKPTADAASRARPAPVIDDAATIEAARTRARRRLVGALVLLVAGVAVFPVFFETQPRPLPMDTPMSARRGLDDAAGAGLPSTAAPSTTGPRSTRATPVLPVLPAETVADAGAPAEPQPAPQPAPSPSPSPSPSPVTADTAAPAPSAARPAPAATTAPVAAPVPARIPAPAATPATPPAPSPTGATVATTPGASQPATPAASAVARFVVQIGAYTDAATLRDARARVEKLGLKTYTQVVDTPGGARTRVRVGPFGTREEADAVAGKVKRSGLPANIVSL